MRSGRGGWGVGGGVGGGRGVEVRGGWVGGGGGGWEGRLHLPL